MEEEQKKLEEQELERKLGISFNEEQSEEIKTVRLCKSVWRRLNERRGYNGCKTFEDTIKHLLDNDNKDI